RRASCAAQPAGASCCTVADTTGVRIRGRTTRERRIADEAAAQVAERSSARAAGSDTSTGTPRARLPSLRALTNLLATGGELTALAVRYRMVREGRVGQNLRHV